MDIMNLKCIQDNFTCILQNKIHREAKGRVEKSVFSIKDSGVFILLATITNETHVEKETKHAFVYNSYYINEYAPSVKGAIIDNRQKCSSFGY